MGPKINSSTNDWIPYVTADGKCFFVVSNRSGNHDGYWDSEKIIEELRPNDFKQN